MDLVSVDLIVELEGCMVEECMVIVILIICIEEDMECFMDHPGRMYGGGMYNSSGFGGPVGGYGFGGCGPYGYQDPNNPYGASSSPPGFRIFFLRVMQGVVNFFDRISILIDQNTQAVHMFMSALLQLFDRSGLLYGELARFVLRLLGIRTKPKKTNPPSPYGLPPHNSSTIKNYSEGTMFAPSGSWDNVWENDPSI